MSKSWGIEIAVSTVCRPNGYVHHLVAGLRGGLRVRLVAGSADADYLKRYSCDPFVDVLAPPGAEWDRLKSATVHHRASWNYWRALSLVSNATSRRGLLVLEDDVSPAHGWEGWLYAAIGQLDEHLIQNDYVLALYVPERCLSQRAGSIAYANYPVHRFFGTQAMYYPEHVRDGFARYLKENGVDHFRTPYDLLLKEFLLKRGFRLFATMPSLFQHCGKVSTGLGAFHQSPYFRPKL